MYTVFIILTFNILIIENSNNLINASPLTGENVKIVASQEFPFIASLKLKPSHTRRTHEHFCTGSLITKDYVLTAEHCINFDGVRPNDVRVALGATDHRACTLMYDVKWWISYDQWADHFHVETEFDDDNDIGIIRLATSVLGSNIKPVAITKLNTAQLYGKKAVIVGWDFGNQDTPARRLKKAVVDILSPEDCSRKLYLLTNERVEPRSDDVCTSATPYVLSDFGDSGGPLLDGNNNLIGVLAVSGLNTSYHWGDFSTQFRNQYEINIHVSANYYRTFINDVIRVP